jgi:hypothetical protein
VLLDVIFAAKKQTKFLKKCEIHCSNSSKHVASVELQLVIGIFCANAKNEKKKLCRHRQKAGKTHYRHLSTLQRHSQGVAASPILSKQLSEVR